MPPLKYLKVKSYLEKVAVRPESRRRMPTVRELMSPRLLYGFFRFICSRRDESIPGMTRPIVSSTVVPTNSVSEQSVGIFELLKHE